MPTMNNAGEVAITGLMWVAIIQAIALGAAFVFFVWSKSREVGALPRKLAEKRALAEERRIQMEEDRHALTMQVQRENLNRSKELKDKHDEHIERIQKIELPAGAGVAHPLLKKLRNPEM